MRAAVLLQRRRRASGAEAVLPSNLVLPSISGGEPVVGQTATASRGSWTGTDPMSFSDEWRRDGEAIPGETGLSYVYAIADVGALITFATTPTNAAGTGTTAVSAPVGPVEQIPAPVLTGPAGAAGAPSLVLTLDEGETVVGTWTADQDVTPALSGADAALFEIVVNDPQSFDVQYLAAPDFDAPSDADTDNSYEVTVEATSGAGLTASQAVSVEVQNVFDNVPALVTASPGLLATNVPIDTDIVLTFDRAISFSADPYAGIWTGSPTYTTLVHEWTSADIGTDPGEMAVAADTLTLRLPSNLSGLTDYRWALDPGAVEAADGSPNAAQEGTFTTEDVDTTAPTLSDTDYSGGTVTFTSDESGTCYWASHVNGAVPTDDQIVAGTGGGIYEAGSFVVDPGFNDEAIVLTSATPDGTVGLSYVVQDDAPAPNTSAIVTETVTHNTPPVLSSPVDAANGATAATGAVTTNDGDGTLYAVVTTSSTAPSAPQIKAGQDHTGAAAAWDGSQAVSSAGVQTLSPAPSGLTATTAYWTHYVQTDAEGTDSNVVSADGFTTGAPHIFELDMATDPGLGSFGTDTGSASFTYDGATSKTFPALGETRTGRMVCDHSTNGASIYLGTSADFAPGSIVVGDSYTFKLQSTYNLGTGTGQTVNARVRIEWVKADGTFVVGDSLVLRASSLITPGGVNEVLVDGEFTGVAPAGAVWPRCALRFDVWSNAGARIIPYYYRVVEA